MGSAEVYMDSEGDFFTLVKRNGDNAIVKNRCDKVSEIPIAELTLQQRMDVLPPEELMKRALRLRSNDMRFGLEPNREVWKAVLTHARREFTPNFAQWLVEDEELFILAIHGTAAWSLFYQLQHTSTPYLNMPDKVSDAVLIAMARADAWKYWLNLLKGIVSTRDDIALEEKLYAENAMLYRICRESVRHKHALGLIKRIEVYRFQESHHPWPTLRPFVPIEFRKVCDRKAKIKARGFQSSWRREEQPKELEEIMRLSDSIAAGGSPSVKSWTATRLQKACIEIGEFYGEQAAVFLRSELQRRHFKIENYLEETLEFLGANLPEEEARKLAIQAEPVCRKRDRRQFEEFVAR